MKPLTTALAALSFCTLASAQLQLSLNFTFVDPNSGGGGNIGVTQDPSSLRYYLVDFSNTQPVHEFDSFGNPLAQFATPCQPQTPSPNDIAFDPITQTLWIVDNNGQVVINIDLQGNCLSGFAMTPAPNNAVGIHFDIVTQTLFVSSDGAITQFDTAGNWLSTIPVTRLPGRRS